MSGEGLEVHSETPEVFTPEVFWPNAGAATIVVTSNATA
jgi:hypothetical protein